MNNKKKKKKRVKNRPWNNFTVDVTLHVGSISYNSHSSQTLCLLSYATFLFAISYTTTYHGALFCMTMAVGCSGFHNSGVLLNPTDIAPNYAGSVFG